jgi:hypothetical protein
MKPKNKNTTRILALSALIAISGGFLLFTSQASAAVGINKQINFQGKVVNADGTNVANGNYNFVFNLYSQQAPGGTAIWTETRTGGNQVPVTDGVFQVNLGEVTALPGSIDFNTDNIYLGVTFHTDSEMTPRVRFTAVPYAFNADKVRGLTVTDTTGTLTIANGKTISFADAFTTTGAFPLTLTATASTTATLPAGTITLADLATGQTLTNKTIGSTGLTFTGATTDITTGTGEDLTIVANGAGIISLNDATTIVGTVNINATGTAATTIGNSSGTFQLTSNGGLNVTTGGALTGVVSIDTIGVSATALTFAGTGTIASTTTGLTMDSGSGVVSVATGDFLALSKSGVSGAAAGYFWYDSSDNKFKINENGTTKVLCNTTDLGCGAGGSTTWDTIGDAAANGAIAMNEYAQTMDWNTASTAAAFDGLTITLTNDAATDTNIQRALVVANQNDGASTGTTEAIMAVVNRDTDETVGSGLVVENTGTGTMTNALQILETAGTITTAINIGNGVTTGISIGTGVTTGISIASGGITSTGEVLFTNTGAGLSFRVNDEAADTTPFVVDAAGNVGIGTTAPNRILDIVQAASAPQLRLSKDLTYYSEFTVDSVGDLQVAAVGGDIRALSENVWVCDNDACPALTLTGEGNIFVENVLKFGNGVYFKNDSATELTVYDNDDQAMLIFDEL